MEGWEKTEQDFLIELYNTGEYLELLTRYCHEGLSIRRCGKEVEASICSYGEKANTVEKALKRLARQVYTCVCKDMLGC